MSNKKIDSNEQSNLNDVSQKVAKKKDIKKVPLNANVWVKSNCVGELIYISKKTGYQVNWNGFGNKQPLSLDELLVLRNTQKKFLEENWIRITGFVDAEYSSDFSVEEILSFLQIKEYFANTLCHEDIDEVFKMTPDDIKLKVPNMSSGVKNAIIARANELIKNGELDSFKIINALESVFECKLGE